MKNYLIFLFCCFFSIMISSESFCNYETIEFYISPKGKDTNPGTQKAPFLTLEKARDAVRIAKNNAKEKPVTVYVHGGNYYLEKTVVFGSEDSGSGNGPIIYEAVAGEEPVFTGSKRLNKWKLLKDKQKLNALDPSVYNKVYVTDLKAAGISNFGDPTKAGARPDLYCNTQLQTLARWPNGKFTKAGLAVGKTVLPPTYIGVHGTKEGNFEYTDKRQNRWAKESDIRVSGYWYWDWAEEYQKVSRIDTATRTIFISEPYHGYGYKDSLRYFGMNLFCEIDQPGEWYLDRGEGMLYWYPPQGIEPAGAEVILTVFSDPYMVEVRNCSNMTLQGLTFRESRGSAILVSEGEDCLIADCRIERFGRDGIHIDKGARNTVSGCMLSTFGHGGMKISGGDRKNLIAGNHHVENTVVEHFSLFKRTYEPAIHLSGCGHRINNNRFQYSSSSAMRLEGNDFLIEYNHFANVVNESDDQGGIDIFYNPSYRGIVIRYNRWSDIRGGVRHGAAGVRLDDMISGVLIYGNVFERVGALQFGGVQIHGGKDNLVENNVFYKCFAAVTFSPWGEERWLKTLDSPEIKKKIFEDVNINSTLYLERYPLLKEIRLDADKNTISNNLIVDCENTFLRNKKSHILINNVQLQSDGNSLDSFCNTELLKKYGLKPVPLKDMGVLKNQWIK
jgi:hypothetical protein